METTISHHLFRNLISLTLLILFLSSCSSTKKNIYLLPEDYKGAVIILFDQPDGASISDENGVNVFTIPKDGILKIKNPLTFTASNELYFYEKVDGERTKIEYLHPKGRGKSLEDNPKTFDQTEPNDSTVFVMGHVVGTFNIKNGIVNYLSFEVGRTADSEKLYLQKQDTIIEIHKQIMNL